MKIVIVGEPTPKRWRMPRKCYDCPFASKGPGLKLRRSLQPGRWREILTALRNDGHFTCHKTTVETGDGSNRLCAGAIGWQDKHGYPSQLRRIFQRIDEIAVMRRAAKKAGVVA